MAPIRISVLRVIGGPGADRTIRVDTDVVVGRDGRPGGVSLADDEEMSRRHARFTPLPTGAVMVEDLGSINGTLVNGERIDIPRLLSVGDEIVLGSTTMRLEWAATDGPPSLSGLGGPTERSGASGASPRGAPSSSGAGRAIGLGVPSFGLETLPPPVPPKAASPAVPSSRRAWPAARRWALTSAVVVVVAAAFAAGRIDGHRNSAPGPSGDDATAIGVVYLESGASQPGANAIIAYQYRAGGDLNPLDLKEYPTGGAGGFDLTNRGVLDTDGQIVLSANHKLLFAINQGSDTVAVFHVGASGALVAVAGSPFPSGGMAPGGLAISGRRLVVVNKAQDGVRDLSSVAPNVTSFLIRSDGSLRPTGSVMEAPLGSSPTEALIAPGGNVVVVPEEHGPFLSFTLSADGKLSPAPGSPFALPNSIFPTGYPTSERWALGLGAEPRGGVLYGEAVNTAQLVVYRYDDSGRLTFVRAVPDPGAYLPCWSLVNAAGTRLYTDNAGNNTMSVFDISDPLNPRQLQLVTLKNGGNPWDLRMGPSGRDIFVLDARDRQDQVLPGQGNEVHTLVVNPDGTLTEPALASTWHTKVAPTDTGVAGQWTCVPGVSSTGS